MSKRKGAPFVISFGEEDFFLDRDIAKARAWKDRNIRKLDGFRASAQDIVTACESMSLDDQDVLVVVDNADQVKSHKSLKTYVADKDPEDVSTVLLAVCRSKTLPDVWSDAGRKGTVTEHRKLKTYETNNEVVRWIPEQAKLHGISLGKGVPDLIFKGTGADLYRIDSELRKLVVLVGPGGRAELDLVRKTVVPIYPVEPSQVADAAFRKDLKTALNTIALLYRSMGDDILLPIVAGLLRQSERLTMARQMLDRGSSEDDIAILLGLHPWWCRTFFLPMARKHDLSELVRAMGRLSRLDSDVKGPSQCKRTLLELAVISIAN